MVLRCFLGAVFGGGITGLLFSLTGGLLALGVMTLTRRIPGLSIYGVSILGAAAHNIGQIAALCFSCTRCMWQLTCPGCCWCHYLQEA